MTEDQSKKLDDLGKKIEAIQNDLKGNADRVGVYEQLRMVSKLVKVSIGISIVGGLVSGGSKINWRVLIDLIQYID